MTATDGAGTARVTLPAPRDVDALAARLLSAGALGIWEQPTLVVAWFDTRPDTLGAALDAIASWTHEPDRDWQEDWKRTVEPVRAGRTVVVPTWLASGHVAAPDELVIVLDPGRAFGSGHHATTLQCLEIIDELDLAGRLRGRTLADVGCGSGVLAIAAGARGATVTAVDIDPAAVEVTTANARANGVHIDVRHGSVDALDEPADLVVANLSTDVVCTLADRLVQATADRLVVSGISEQRAAPALSALEAAGATLASLSTRDGWIVATLDVDRPPVAIDTTDRRGSAP